jgi:hypothetical protein
MLTIHNLEVRFEVEGDGDDAVFARLFEQHMRRWQSIEGHRRAHELRLANERKLTDDSRDEEP